MDKGQAWRSERTNSPVTQRRSFPKGTLIFSEGSPASEAYIVQEGSVRLFRTVGSREVTVSTRGPSMIFGEFALLDGGARSASAEAVENTICAVIHRDMVQQMLEQTPKGVMVLVRAFLQTARAMSTDLAASHAKIGELQKALDARAADAETID